MMVASSLDSRIASLTLWMACVSVVWAGAADAQRVRKAPDVWVQACLSCHGSPGGNGSASSLLDDDWTVGNGSDEDLFNAIHDGVPEAGRDGFGEALSDADIRALVVYIGELRSQDRGAQVIHAR